MEPLTKRVPRADPAVRQELFPRHRREGVRRPDLPMARTEQASTRNLASLSAAGQPGRLRGKTPGQDCPVAVPKALLLLVDPAVSESLQEID